MSANAISQKRKRSNPSLPALTIVTRSSVRKQSSKSQTSKPSRNKQKSSTSTLLKEDNGMSASAPSEKKNKKKDVKCVSSTSTSPTRVNSRPALPLRETRSSSKLNSVNTRSKDNETPFSDTESEYESENEQDSSKSFKRIKLQAPMYIFDESLPMPAPVYNNDIHDEYDDEDDDEEMPKFQYESKFKSIKSGSSTATTPALYTAEERKIFNDMLFSEFVDFDEPTTSPMDYDVPPMEPTLDFVSADDLDTDLPLVTPLELSQEAAAEKKPTILASKVSNTANTRWPINQQDNSTSFSILVKESNATTTTPQKEETMPKTNPQVHIKQEQQADHEDAESLFEKESLDDFFMYDSASSMTEDDESDSTGHLSPSCSTPEAPATVATDLCIEPLIWTDKKIPICGYRDRNQTLNLPSGTPLHPKRIMAALASLAAPSKNGGNNDNEQSPLRFGSSLSSHSHQKLPATAYYQQALVVATGINRRSLFSGKAREMIAMGDTWA